MNYKLNRIIFVIWSLIIFTLTSYPKLTTGAPDIVGIDKVAHFVMYLIFALLYMRMRKDVNPKSQLRYLLFLSIIVPIVDELHQIPISGRSFSFWDIVADLMGFVAVFCLYRFLKKVKL